MIYKIYMKVNNLVILVNPVHFNERFHIYTGRTLRRMCPSFLKLS
jgi:hypothetical protein